MRSPFKQCRNPSFLLHCNTSRILTEENPQVGIFDATQQK